MKNTINLMMATLVCVGSIASCSFGPTAKLADGSFITTGGSVFSSGQADARQASLPNGLNLNWVRTNYEETSVAKTALGSWGLAKFAAHAAQTQQTNLIQNSQNLKTTTDGATAASALSKATPGSAITAPGVVITPPPAPPVIP